MLIEPYLNCCRSEKMGGCYAGPRSHTVSNGEINANTVIKQIPGYTEAYTDMVEYFVGLSGRTSLENAVCLSSGQHVSARNYVIGERAYFIMQRLNRRKK